MALTTARSTQGFTVSVDTEDSLGEAAGNAKDWRLEEAPTFPTNTRELERQANLSAENPSSMKDPPIPYEMAREGAITLPMTIRRGADANVPPLITLLEAGSAVLPIITILVYWWSLTAASMSPRL
jgi:hypothetical protein